MHRSLLFVPGNRPDRFEKACRSEADLVCIDLEDAVGPAAKEGARESVMAFLGATQHGHVALRLNGADTPFYEADLEALSGLNRALPFIMLPKLSSRFEVDEFNERIARDKGPIFGLVESAKGIVNCEAILAYERVEYALYGAIDYAGDVGCGSDWETHLYNRSRMVAACAAFDVTLFDSPFPDVKDLEGLRETTEMAKELGIFARSAIHPAQIHVIHDVFAPSDTEIADARRVIDAYEASDGNVVLLDGKMVEEPMVKSARRVLSRA